jgi:hypothetical protein
MQLGYDYNPSVMTMHPYLYLEFWRWRQPAA